MPNRPTSVDILLVEDDPDDVELTLRAIKRSNMVNRVDIARDGEQALAMLIGPAAEPATIRPRVVFLDLKLPKVDGLEVLRRLKEDESTRTIPVVILTSSRESPDLQKAYELGVNSYLVKPVSLDEFSSLVERATGYWMRLNEAKN